jgi:hypothetical protein
MFIVVTVGGGGTSYSLGARAPGAEVGLRGFSVRPALTGDIKADIWAG